MNKAKLSLLLTAVCAAGITFTACGKKEQPDSSSAPVTGSVSDSSPAEVTAGDPDSVNPADGGGTPVETDATLETGDIDGDGFLENTVESDGGAIEEAARDIGSAASEIADDITDGTEGE